MHNEKELKWFDRHKVDRPKSFSHDVKDTPEHPLSEQIPRLKLSNWRIQGNMLIADTEHGEFAQRISPEFICMGTDEAGLPILKKVV